MKHTFINKDNKEQTVTIPEEDLQRSMKSLGITKREAVELYLSDKGYVTNEVVEALTAKANANGVSGTRGVSKKKRKAPTRKPDMDKRTLVQELADALKGLSIAADDEGNGTRPVENIEVTNIERMIAFTLGEDHYEVTLTKKRKPKNQ